METLWPAVFAKEQILTEPSRITDVFGRTFPYLRLSITDICNFKCSYCLPDGYKKVKGTTTFMSKDEIVRMARAFAGLGTWKIRLTGGEPTVRSDFIEIAEEISNIKNIKKLAFTTNGYKLKERAASYYNAGLSHINISVDSLSSGKFQKITGSNTLEQILEGINECFAVGFKNIKLNTVLLKGLNDGELDDFIDFVADKPISLRFIELMQTRDNKDYFDAHHLAGTAVTEKLLARGWALKPRDIGAGPAQEFSNKSSKGCIGIIAPYSKDFCKSCNRLRVSARGALHLCLFGEGGYDLRSYLQNDDQCEELQNKIMELMNFKKSSHFLHEGNSGVRQHLASIGG